MPGQQTRARRQGSLNLNAAGQQFTIQLGRGMIYRELVLRLSGTIAITGGAANNTAAGWARGDEWAICARIEVIANGGDVIRSFTGPQLRVLNHALGGQPRVSAQIGDAATASPAFDSTLIIPFWQPFAIRPMDTALDSSKVGDLRLVITTDASANIHSNGTGAIAAVLDVHSIESFGVQGIFTDFQMASSQTIFAGATTEGSIDLVVGPVYRAILINAANGASSLATDLPNAISNVKIKSGTTVFRDMQFRALQDWQRQRMNMGRENVQNVAATAPITGGFLNRVKSTRQDEDAWALIDLVQDGYLSEAIDTIGYSELKLELNVSAAATITIIPFKLYPPRKRAA